MMKLKLMKMKLDISAKNANLTFAKHASHIMETINMNMNLKDLLRRKLQQLFLLMPLVGVVTEEKLNPFVQEEIQTN